jgi:LAS superfamily LD-carboxypeptidase LdcB
VKGGTKLESGGHTRAVRSAGPVAGGSAHARVLPSPSWDGPTANLDPASLLYLQRAAGNATVAALLAQTTQREAATTEAVANPAKAEWDAHKSIHGHFDKEGFEGYLAIRPLYVGAGLANPAKWLDETVANNEVKFFGHKTPGHPDLQPPLTAAQEKLKSAPAINSFWSFVPRTIRGSKRISNHALGRAIDINPSTNPRIIGSAMIRVIKAVTGVDLGKTQEEDAMRQASEVFKTKFDDSFIATQLDEIKSLRQQQTDLKASKSKDGRAVKKLTGRIKEREKLVGDLRGLAKKGFLDLPHDFVEALKSSGLQWGGDYKSSKDYMHFELGPMASPGAAVAPPQAKAPQAAPPAQVPTTSNAAGPAAAPKTVAAPAPGAQPAAAPAPKGIEASVPTAQGAVRRITVEGLTRGFQPPKKVRPGDPTPGEAIVLIPPSVADDSRPVEVLVHLHGHGIGFRTQTKQLLKDVRHAGTKVGEVRDVVIDKTEAQLAASGRHMVAVLPQGGTHSEFGANFDPKSYSEEAFTRLVAMGVWKQAPAVDGVVMSGHSGAGATFAATMRTQSHRPDYLREVVMFDSINGSGELKSIAGWLLRQLGSDLTALKAATSVQDRQQLLSTGFRFRGYFSHNWIYPDMYKQLETQLNTWFERHDGELQQLGIAGQLRQNYLPIIDAGNVAHERIMGENNRFVEALGALGAEAPVAPSNAKAIIAPPKAKAAAAPAEPAHGPDTKSTTAPATATANVPAAAPKQVDASGKWTGTADQKDFLERVLKAHIALSSSRAKHVLPDLSGDELEDVPGTDVQMKKGAGAAAGQLIADANAALKAASADDADAKLTTRIGATSGYRGRSEQETLWRGYFPGHYDDTRALRAKAGKKDGAGEHGDGAAVAMRDYVRRWIAAPGFSNHQAGIAIDLKQFRVAGHTIKNSSNSAQLDKWRASWLWNWLDSSGEGQAKAHEFGPYTKEPWHWEYKSAGR